MKLNTQKRKWIFYTAIAISFLAILVYNFLTPLMSDELLFDTSMYHSFADLIKEEYKNYMTWNGRTVVQFLLRCVQFWPKWLFNIVNSVIFVVLMLLIYWNVDEKKEYDFVLYTLINLLIWQFGVSFDQTVLWMSGACNYLWGATIILGFVTFYRYKVKHAEEIKHEKLLTIGMFFFGVLGGWCNENTSGGGLLIVLFVLGSYYWAKKNIKPWMITGAIGMFTGLLIMVMAPGNKGRGALMRAEEEHQGLLAIVGRFLKINIAVETYLFPMLLVIVLLLTYFVLKGSKLKDIINVLLFVVVSIATSYALIMTPQPMDRAYFGAGIFMTIALVQAIAYIPKEDIYLNTLKYGGVIVFTAFMYFVYFENGADLMRVLREVNEREEYILEQKEQGNLNLTVPMLRPEFQTKYTFIYGQDVDNDPESWGCYLYKTYYDLESLVGVPRDEWTAY